MMTSIRSIVCVAALLTSVTGWAAPLTLEVFAQANSSSGGTALDTGIDLSAGDRLTSSVAADDCWSAGAADRVSNANGLDGLSPAPCQPSGNYGFHSQDGETFRFGALVGRIASGDWFLMGTSLDSIVSQGGRLFLAYWDSNSGDNFGSISVRLDVNPTQAVPSPGTLALAALGLFALAGARRLRSARA